MIQIRAQVVDVFPLSTAAFGIHPDWFTRFLPRITPTAFLLMILLLLISVGVMTLKRFENAQLENKVWNLPIIITAVIFWPAIVVALKDLVDAFNTFLVRDIFQIPWQGFGFPSLNSFGDIVGWSAEGLARFLPNVAYWLIYSFYVIFFFFFAVLGPFVLAKGILMDEIEALVELLKELTVLFLWQTTVIVLVAFILPDIVSGRPYPPNPEENFYFLSFLLGVLLLFVPSITRKFGNHLGSSFFPAGFRLGGALLGMSVFARLGTAGFMAAGVPTAELRHNWELFKRRVLGYGEYAARAKDKREIQRLQRERFELEKEVDSYQAREHRREVDETKQKTEQQTKDFLKQAQRAKAEVLSSGGEGEGAD